MARKCTEENVEETRLISCHEEEEDDDDDEEALSFCDLPVNISREVDAFGPSGEEYPGNGEFHEASTKTEEDFDFGFDAGFRSSLRVGSEPAEMMSTADELFFKGRILPLRHSVSLDGGLPGSTRDSTRFLSRAESGEFRRTGSFASGGSSRSSSCCSHYSSSTTNTAGAGGSDRKIKNNFINYSHPSPQPQIIRRTSSLTARVSTSRNSRSSLWDFLRLGLVRAPEIELQDLKLRTTAAANTNTSVSRNSSCSSTSTSGNSSNKKKTTKRESRTRKQRHGLVATDRKIGFLFGDCRCTAAVVEAVPLKNSNISGETVGKTTGEDKKQRKKKTKEEKVAMTRKRTFEWLKELSHSSFVDHGRSFSS